MAYKMSVRRKIAIASWDAPRSGNIYGKIILDVDPVLNFIDKCREKYGIKLTITHVIGKAVGDILAKMDDLNGQIILGKYVPHKSVNITFLVQINEGSDLAKVKIDDVNKKSLHEIAIELQERAKNLRSCKDPEYEKSKNVARILPTFLLKPMLSMVGYLTGVLGLNLKFLGLEPYPFGSCIITSVGMIGIDEGFPPPTPFARVPIYICIPTIKKRPVADGDEIILRKQLDLTATIDHRFIDGFQGAVITKSLKEIFSDPEKYFLGSD